LVAMPPNTETESNSEDRAKWGNSIEFLMSCIAMNVGLGNIWRFPFVAYENGGGAFLIPYISVLILLGRPMYYLEMCLGQFSSRGNVKMRGIRTAHRYIFCGYILLFTNGTHVLLFNPFFYCRFALVSISVTLEGAGTGILYFVTPDWDKLLSAKVWYSAVTQCFFSLNIGFGSVTMYASYNNFYHNVYRDAMVVTTLDTFTSFLSGLIIFGILGNLAYKMDVEVSDVVKSGGTGLAFISYPEAIARFEMVPWLFAILFFFMLFVLGAGSLVALQGCAFTVIMDAFPHLKIWQVSLSTAIVGFIIGLVYITPGGQYIFTMVDFFGGTFIFYVLTIVEVFSIMWWYGLENICLDIEFMLKKKPGIYWRICWSVIIPIVLVTVFVYFLVTLEELTYEDKQYPKNIIVWGWLLFGVGIMQPVIWWIVQILQNFRKESFTKN
ncbi:sodium-dependent nutrient amino acid transporter 1, partial [Asbolus verrucosus]